VSFKDHFSRQATDYAKFRPEYPRSLFAFVAAAAPDDQLALDCATGNGQAAVALAEFFQKVIALDASADQIANAQPNERVKYRVAPAESTGLPARSVAAITVAQALHWFDLDAFYAEARRVLAPRGVIAVWAYNYLRLRLTSMRSSGVITMRLSARSGRRNGSWSGAAIARCRFLFTKSKLLNFRSKCSGRSHICLAICAPGRRLSVSLPRMSEIRWSSLRRILSGHGEIPPRGNQQSGR